MRPDEIPVVWPSSEQIARAVFVAAALEGDDPIDVLQGSAGAGSRAYAFLALAFEFPTAPRSALARKFGKAECANGARKALVAGAWSWFDLGRLNAVRATLGLPDMTLEDAKAAPLLYCGRAWQEFADRGAEQREAPTSSAVDPAAGSGGDEKPAPIVESVSEPKADESERLAAVERRKAWARPEPGDKPEEDFVNLSAPVENPVPQPEVKSEPVCQPETAPAPPAPLRETCTSAAALTPSSRAVSLAGAARAMQAAKPQPQRVTPPALVTRPVEREIKGAPRPGGSNALFAPSPKEPRAEVADTRRPRDDFRARLLNESLRGVTSFRPDPPAEKRGAVNVTSDLMGDPDPSRSALGRPI